MKTHPILFNTEMVRAILDGRKTVTRRVARFQNGANPNWTGYIADGSTIYGSNNIPAAKAPYRKGDILYVRETFSEMYPDDKSDEICSYLYKADRYKYGEEYQKEYDLQYPDGKNWTWKGVWNPSIHMPKEAARIWLKVTNIRAEKLQAMTAYDAVKEGIHWQDVVPCIPSVDYPSYIDADAIVEHEQELEEKKMLKSSFGKLWDSTIKKSDLPRHGWDANPWVWVIDFERREKP